MSVTISCKFWLTSPCHELWLMVKQKVFFANITYSYFQKTLKTDMWIYQQVKMNDVLRRSKFMLALMNTCISSWTLLFGKNIHPVRVLNSLWLRDNCDDLLSIYRGRGNWLALSNYMFSMKSYSVIVLWDYVAFKILSACQFLKY